MRVDRNSPWWDVITGAGCLGIGGFMVIPAYNNGLPLAEALVLAPLWGLVVALALSVVSGLTGVLCKRTRCSRATGFGVEAALGYLCVWGLWSYLRGYGFGVECALVPLAFWLLGMPMAVIPLCWDAGRGLVFLAEKAGHRLQAPAESVDAGEAAAPNTSPVGALARAHELGSV